MPINGHRQVTQAPHVTLIHLKFEGLRFFIHCKQYNKTRSGKFQMFIDRITVKILQKFLGSLHTK